jgi:stress response protein YsnF
MSIFNNYPKVNYKINDYDYLTAIDITTNYRIRKVLSSYRGISYRPYVIEDGERPDNVSQKLYDTPNFDWVILFVNEIHSVYDEWPRDRETLKRYIIDKYGSLSAAQSTIKYYYDANKNIIDLTTYNSLPAQQRSLENAYEYEIRLNTNKSIIKVVSLSVAKSIETDLRSFNLKPAL